MSMAATVGDTEDELLVVRKNEVVSRFLQLLNNFDYKVGEQIAGAELQDIKSSMCKSDKALLHLILITYLDLEIIQDALHKNEVGGVLSDLLDLVEKDDDRKLTIAAYHDIVVHLELVEEHFAMLLTLTNPMYMTEMVRGIVKTITHYEQGSLSLIRDATVNIVKLALYVESESVRESYFHCLKVIFAHALECQQIRDFEKLNLIFDVLCVSLLDLDMLDVILGDGKLDLEIRQGLTEAKFDQIVCRKPFIIYETLFGVKCKIENDLLATKEVLTKLDEVVNSWMAKQIKDLTSEDVFSDYDDCVTAKLSSYTGSFAYLISVLAESQGIAWDSFPSLSKLLFGWVERKPKMETDDFEESGLELDFNYFCGKVMEKLETGSACKNSWITMFLGFSPSEIVGTNEGCKLAEKVIVGAPQEIVFEYLEIVSKFDGELNDSQKQLVLNVIFQGACSDFEVDARIRKLYSKVTNNKLRLADFSSRLNTICAQLTTIEFETDAAKLAKYKSEVIYLCAQDPLEAVSRLMDHSIRTEHFRALEFASAFFSLTAVRVDDGEETQAPETLLPNCLSNIMKRLPPYPDSTYALISSGIMVLISKKALAVDHIFYVFKFRILKLLSSKSIAISVLSGLVVLLKDLVSYLMSIKVDGEVALLKEIASFVVRLNRFFAFFNNKNTFHYAMIIRNKLAEMIGIFKSAKLIDIVELEPKSVDLDDKTLMDIGILYIRCEELRKIILKSAKEENLFTDLRLNDCVKNTLLWVSNSSEYEWPSVIQLLFEVVIVSKHFSTMMLLNESLLAMYYTTQLKSIDAFLHILRFYDFAIEHLKGKGLYGVTERNSVVNCLITLSLSISMTKSATDDKKFNQGKENPGLFQILTNLLGKVLDCKGNGLDDASRDDLRVKMNNFPPLDSRCDPIRLLIKKQLACDD